MSRRGRSASHNVNPVMGPPPDRDVVMGPPPVPSPSQPSGQKEKGDINDKYRKLKRRYFELEEKHKETSTELQRSGERNVRMREERNVLLDRIIELESQGVGKTNGAGSASPPPVPASQPGSSALPRSLLSARARDDFVGNLRRVVAEGDMNVDDDVDPLLTSRHIGPLARKRAEEERIEEEANDTRRSTRRGKNSQQSAASHKGKETSANSGNGESFVHLYGSHQGTSPTLVSSTGTKLRIKPPALPQNEAGPSGSSNAHNGTTPSASSSRSSHLGNSHDQRSESPLSTVPSPVDNGGNYSPYDSPGPAAVSSQTPSPRPAHADTSASTTGPVQQGLPQPSPYYRHTSVGGNSNTSNSSFHSNSTRHSANPSHSLTMSHNNAQSGSNASGSSGQPVQRHAKPKRLKAHTVTTKSFSIPMVPRDKSGAPMLPLNVGIMTVIHLGKVCMREHFHTERYIFPVGYEVTRRYASTIDPEHEVVYHCTVLDGGDGPKFQIVPSDTPERVVIAGTATGAWSNIVKQANAIRNRQHSNSVSGPDFFGFGQNTIKHLIQELPGANQLRDYVWQNFVEGGPLGGRHAAVIPALPEEYDSALPIGSYFPHDRDRGMVKREDSLRRIPGNAEGSSSATQQSTSQVVQAGVTQIVLPPPTTSETLNIQEYQPPAPKDNKRKMSGSGSPVRVQIPSPMPQPQPTRSYYRTRSDSIQSKTRSRSPSGSQPPLQHPSPYLTNSNTPSTTATPPPVPATFASIMNAYPVPAPGSTPEAKGSGSDHTSSNVGGSASNASD